jgi:hypothetical protein
MIKDTVALQEVQHSWRGVEALRGKLSSALLGSFAEGASFAIFAADAAHNLPFVHACAVLNDVLEQLQTEGHFPCKSIFLGPLLSASEARLPWTNFAVMQEVAARRNGVAHRGDVLSRTDCWRYIDAIKAELVSWRIL